MANPAPQPDPDPAAIATAPTVHHVPARRRRKQGLGGEKMQLNLTSMIDVIFLLLVYFVITANFAVNEGVLTAKLPQGQGQAAQSLEPPDQPLEIQIRSAGQTGAAITMENQTLSSFADLTRELASLQYDPERGRTSGVFKPDNPVLIQPRGDVRWQHVVNAFNAAIRARYSNVRFAQPQPSP